MNDDNIWLQGREAETTSLRQILLPIEDVTDTSHAVRGAGVNDRPRHGSDDDTEENLS